MTHEELLGSLTAQRLPIILPTMEPGYRELWEGELILDGAEFWDYRTNRWEPCTSHSVGTMVPRGQIHNSLVHVAVRVLA